MSDKHQPTSEHAVAFSGRKQRIRDNVHGDIEISGNFLQIINTPEFQRLRRIRQLATAQYVFPSADHTRFIHSLGTFAVMQKIIAHFEEYFQSLGGPVQIKKEDKDALLIASLLHDLGHTPFSHAMEDIFFNARRVPHEKWTIDIIQREGPLRSVIKDKFGEGYVKRVTDLIYMQHNDSNLDPSFPPDKVNMENIFHSLISSQLDADRLDYIRRDAISTGVTYGLIDVERLIDGFRIGILNDGTATVCIDEDYLQDIEGYLYARYQMYRNVYLAPFKMLTEDLLRKIMRCVFDLHNQDQISDSDLPAGFKAVLQQAYMSEEDYLSLDDYVIMGAVKGWAALTDARAGVLSGLCRCLINREGFQRYTFRSVSDKNIAQFSGELMELMAGAFPNAQLPQEAGAFPFIVLRVEQPKLYTPGGSSSIYILEKSGRLTELSQRSHLVRSFMNLSEEDGEPTAAVSAIYFSADMLKCYLKQKNLFGSLKDDVINGITERVRTLFEQYSVGNSIEIEKKYVIPQYISVEDALAPRLVDFFRRQGYQVGEPEVVDQVDHYMDTPDDKLRNSQCTFRIRVKEGRADATYKKPVMDSSSCGRDGQMERYEYACTLTDYRLETGAQPLSCSKQARGFVQKHLDASVSLESLTERITIQNHRTKYQIFRQRDQSPTEEYELVLDCVTYTNTDTGRFCQEKQLELELKSDPMFRLNMLILTGEIEKELQDVALKPITDSKYERAKRLTIA